MQAWHVEACEIIVQDTGEAHDSSSGYNRNILRCYLRHKTFCLELLVVSQDPLCGAQKPLDGVASFLPGGPAQCGKAVEGILAYPAHR